MTLEGVDVNVLIPGTWAPASSAFEPALTTGLYDAYHTYMRDFCSADTNRLKGLFLAPGNESRGRSRSSSGSGASRGCARCGRRCPKACRSTIPISSRSGR